MHRIANRFRSVVHGSVATFILVAPTLALAAWSVAYLHDAFQTVLSPGVPLDLPYKGQDGTYRILAESFALDLNSQKLTGKRLKVLQPDGKVMLAARSFSAVRNPNGSVHVIGDFPELNIVRLKNGRTNIEMAMPPGPQQQGPDTPFSVSIPSAEVSYRDATWPDSKRQKFSLRGVEVEGLGDDILLNTVVKSPGLGPLPLRVQSYDGNSFDIWTQFNRSDPKPVLDILQPMLGKDAVLPSWESAEITGPFRAMQFDGKPWSYTGSLTFDLQNLSYADWVKNRELSGKGELRPGYFSGPIALTDPNSSFKGNLAVRWDKQVQTNGSGKIEVKRSDRLEKEILALIPKDVAWQGGQWDGRFATTKDTWWVDGKASVRQLAVQNQTVEDLTGLIAADNQLVRADQVQAKYKNLPVTATIAFKPSSNSVQAGIQWSNLKLTDLPKEFRLKGLTGRFSGTALIRGSLQQPEMDVHSEGLASYHSPDVAQPITGLFDVTATGDLKQITLQRGLWKTSKGAAAVSGTVGLKNKSLDLSAIASGIDLKLINPELSGKGYGTAEVKGTFDAPKIVANAEVFRLKFDQFYAPYVQASISNSKGRWSASNAELTLGLSKAFASIEFDPKTKALSGEFHSPGIQIAEFVPGPVAGFVEIRDGRISGTTDKPSFEASLFSAAIAASGVTSQNLQARIIGNKDSLQLQNGRLEIEQNGVVGVVQASGTYAIQNKQLQGSAAWEATPLGAIANLDARYAVEGATSGQAKFVWRDGKWVEGTASIGLSDITINRDPLGSGNFEAKLSNDTLVANGSIGSLDRFLVVDRAEQNLSTQTGSASANAYNLQLSKISKLAEPLIKDSPDEARRLLAETTGNLGANILANWNKEGISGSVREGRLTDIRISGAPAGDLQFEGSRLTDASWAVNELDWTADTGATDDVLTTLKGSIASDSQGVLNGDLELRQLSLPWLTNLKPTLKAVPVTVDSLFLQVGGTQSEPVAVGSMRAVAIPREDLSDRTAPSVDLYNLLIKKDQLTSEGQFQASGFTGSLNVRVPFAAFDSNPAPAAADKFRVVATATPRSISEFKDVLPNLDAEKSKGTIAGEIIAEGNVDQFSITGQASLNSEVLAMKGARTQLRDSSITLRSADGELGLEFNLNSNLGGNVTGAAVAPLNLDFERPLRQLLHRTPVSGKIASNGFVISEGDLASANALQILLGDSNLTITGSAAEPLIEGKVVLQQINLDIPPLQGSGEPLLDPYVNPQFNIDFVSPNPGEVRSLTSQFSVTGQAHLGGNLVAPNILGNMDIQSGVLRLPNARIRLDEGGRIDLIMRTLPGGATDLRVPVQMTGRTSVTARRPGNRYERYDLTLYVTGDLVDPETGLQIKGTSEPGDLSEQEILAIVGQRELFESIANLARDSRNNELQNLLLSYALPSLTDPITGNIANTLKLDYVNLEYNPFEGPTIVAARSLNKYVTLQGRRILPIAGYNNDAYEFKLVYRIPSQNPLLSRSRLSLVSATGKPWRLAFEYSYRF